jgi:hypothetical protein
MLQAGLVVALEDAGTALLAGAPVPVAVARAWPSFASIVGQCRDSIAPRDRLPPPTADEVAEAAAILSDAVRLIRNASMLRVVVLAALINPKTGLRYYSDKALGPRFRVSPPALRAHRRAALRDMAAAMVAEAGAAEAA